MDAVSRWFLHSIGRQPGPVCSQPAAGQSQEVVSPVPRSMEQTIEGVVWGESEERQDELLARWAELPDLLDLEEEDFVPGGLQS